MTLFYKESGRPKKGLPLVLLHGFCETHEIWKPLEPGLAAAELHALSPDLPGFGQSPLPDLSDLFDKTPNLPLLADILYKWLREQKIKECILLGHSLGGYISLAFLEKYPHMVAGIALMHSTAYADTEERKRSREHVIGFVEKHGVEKFIDTFLPQLFYTKNRQKLQPEIAELLAIARQTPKETLIAYTRAMQQRRERLQVLQNSQKPVLYIAGDHDNSIPLEDSLQQSRSIPNCRLHVLPDTGHMGMYEKPEESLELIRNFADLVDAQKK